MNTNFTKIELNSWDRHDQFEHFTKHAPCGYTMSAEIDLTNLYNYAKSRNIKLYPSIVACMAKIINSNKEFRYYMDKDGNFGYFDVLHPLFFDRTTSENVKVFYAEYDENFDKQLDNIEAVKKEFSNIDKYCPQKTMPVNTVNISCIPWVNFSSVSFDLPYSTYYFFPVITFGKFIKKDDKILIPLSIAVNHAVNDGYHTSKLFNQFQELINSLK